MRFPVRQRSSTVVAALAAATVALYGLASLSGLLHLARERHEICAEHGAMVHPGHEDRPAAPSLADGPSLAAALAPEAHGHHHCAVGDHLRQDGLPTPPRTLAPPAPPAHRAAPRSLARAHGPVATLFLAPKHSPPATT